MCEFKKFNHCFVDLNDTLEEVSQDGKRYYSTPGGIFPSVTTVVGFEKQQFFSEWRKKNPEESKRVTSRGTKFHNLIEKYIKNEDINYDEIHSSYKSLFSLIKNDLDKIDNIHAIETPLWSKTLGLAGRTDCIGEYDGKLSIIDFKASTKEKRAKDIDNYFAQATAYALMYQERTGIVVKNYAILIACEDGIKQVFQGNPINHVKNLKGLINKYKEYYGVSRTTDTEGQS